MTRWAPLAPYLSHEYPLLGQLREAFWGMTFCPKPLVEFELEAIFSFSYDSNILAFSLWGKIVLFSYGQRDMRSVF